jgi:hypothetical protein
MGKIVHESALKSNFRQIFSRQSTLVRGRFSSAEFFYTIYWNRSFAGRILGEDYRPEADSRSQRVAMDSANVCASLRYLLS